MEIAEALGTEREREVIDEQFTQIRGISVDYGIMENARDVVVIPANFHWSDVGHWAAVNEVSDLDENQNAVDADALLLDVRDSVIYSRETERLVAVCGVDGLVVVDTPDALLVIPRDRAQDVKSIVEELKKAGRDEFL
jgi:mannose-1-phosphate guanylyltransferase